MNNPCFFRPFEKSVNNDNLYRIGEIKVSVNAANDASQDSRIILLQCKGGEKYRFFADNGGSFAIGIGGTVHTDYTYEPETDGNRVLVLSTGTYTLHIINKYGIKIALGNTNSADNVDKAYGVNVGDFEWSPLTQVSLSGVHTTGDYKFHDQSTLTALRLSMFSVKSTDSASLDLSNISAASSLIALIKYGGTVTGNINVLGALRSLTQLIVPNHDGVSGSIESLAAAQVAGQNPRTSGELACQLSNTGCTWNGAEITQATVTIKFGSSMVNPTEQETTQGYQIV